MNIFKQLNLLFSYIEDNLFEEIDLLKLSQFIGTSINNFKSFFSLLTGMSIFEYIKRRRISESVKFLKDKKVIDIAILCGYENRASFSRAFKAFHGYNPTEYDETKSFNYTPILQYNESNNFDSIVQAKYKIINQIDLFCISKKCKDSKSIPSFWEASLNEVPLLRLVNKKYGLVYKLKNKDSLLYYIGAESKFHEDNKFIRIESGIYLSLTLKNDSEAIAKIAKSMKSKHMDEYPNIEIYYDENVELLFKVIN